MHTKNTPTVPPEMIGCWRRRYIRYQNGTEDTATQVLWLQTGSAAADMRIPATRPDLSNRTGFADCNYDELLALAAQDCACAVTYLDASASPYPTANWELGEHGFMMQPVVNFPEPGWFEWREDNTCMMEWAPSGAYEEDWRLESGSQTFAAHLVLDDEATKTCLLVAGQHAVFARGRAHPIDADVALPILVELAKEDLDNARALVDCEFSYARRDSAEADYVIRLSTLPWREGQTLSLDWLTGEQSGQDRLSTAEGNTWRVVSWSET